MKLSVLTFKVQLNNGFLSCCYLVGKNKAYLVERKVNWDSKNYVVVVKKFINKENWEKVDEQVFTKEKVELKKLIQDLIN
ncbi:MAG: hypothetical protein ACPLKS_08000 [Caldisericum exile]|uniref:hypothetical protein n=1 Tax=Caldisericum exile TaxID=693075 RepID=UPI003C7473E0